MSSTVVTENARASDPRTRIKKLIRMMIRLRNCGSSSYFLLRMKIMAGNTKKNSNRLTKATSVIKMFVYIAPY